MGVNFGLVNDPPCIYLGKLGGGIKVFLNNSKEYVVRLNSKERME